MAAAIRIRLRPILPVSLAIVTVSPEALVRVSGHRTGEPYFGTHQGNRFDDPEPDPAKRYGTSYFGENFSVALAETLLHDCVPEKMVISSSSLLSSPAVTTLTSPERICSWPT